MDELLQGMQNRGTLRDPLLLEAFKKIDRKHFVLPEYEQVAYGDYQLPIGHGSTISQPTTVAFMLGILDIKPGHIVLDVGSGSGYSSALLAMLVGPTGRVYGTEIVPELVKMGRQNVKKYKLPNVSINEAGNKLGLVEHAPYDRILVSAAADKVPDELVLQLKDGGHLVMPVGEALVHVKKKSAHEWTLDRHEGYIFVPLRAKDEMLD